MPNAIQLMAKSAHEAGLTMDGTVKSMLALQQTGGLISSKVLPVFAKNLSLAARNNGGLEKALLSNRVAMNRFMFAIQEAADTFFKSGFSEGLTEFFNTTASSIREMAPMWQGLGKVIGSALKGIALILKVVTPLFVAWGHALDGLTNILGEFSAVIGLTFGTLAAGKIMGFGTAIKFVSAAVLVLLKRLAYLALAAGAVDEVMNVFTKDKEGVLFSGSAERERMNKPKDQWSQGDRFQQSLSNLTNPEYWSSRFSFGSGNGRGGIGGMNNASSSGSGSGNLSTQVNLYLDKEKVASSFIETNAAQSAIDNRVANVTGQ